jgi:hypothetical protein
LLHDSTGKNRLQAGGKRPQRGYCHGAIIIAAAAGAAIGSIAGGSIKRIKQPEPFTKEKKPDPSTDIEAQLEAARERLRRFNEMEMEEKDDE